MTARLQTSSPQWPLVPPLPPKTPRGLNRTGVELAAIVLVVIGPTVRAVRLGLDGGWWIVAIGTIGSVLLGLLPDRLWWARPGVYLASWAALASLQGELSATWVAVMLLVTDWVLRDRPPVPGVPRAGRGAAIPLVVITAFATWRGSSTLLASPVLVLMAVLLVVTVLGAVLGDRFDRIIRQIGHVAGVVVGTVLFAVLGMVIVVLPWLAHRLARIDPLDWPAAPDTRWIRRSRPAIEPSELWSTEAAERRHPLGWRVRKALAVPVLIVLCVGVIAAAGRISAVRQLTDAASSVFNSDDGGVWEIQERQPAYRGADWYDEYQQDIDFVLNDRSVWFPLRAFRVADVETRHVNVSNGVRRSWEAPDCDCQRLRVWMYGGSTTFGIGQRDGHTIASELARVAWQHGIALDVSNRGVPGHTHWSEANRFAWDLTLSPPPDLVIFYDGVNEIWRAQFGQTEEESRQPLEPLTDDIWDGVKDQGVTPRELPPGARVPAATPLPDASATELGRRASSLYDRTRKMSADSAAANDVPIFWFWQPSRMSRDARDDEPTNEDGSEQWRRELYRGAETAVPDGVIDLTSVFDDVDAPLFSDEVHHNELGARVVAEEIFSEIRPELDQLLAKGEDPS